MVYIGCMKKVRTNIYLTAMQHAALGSLSDRTGIPTAALIRHAIDNFLEERKKGGPLVVVTKVGKSASHYTATSSTANQRVRGPR